MMYPTKNRMLNDISEPRNRPHAGRVLRQRNTPGDSGIMPPPFYEMIPVSAALRASWSERRDALSQPSAWRQAVCAENLIHVDEAPKSAKLAALIHGT